MLSSTNPESPSVDLNPSIVLFSGLTVAKLDYIEFGEKFKEHDYLRL